MSLIFEDIGAKKVNIIVIINEVSELSATWYQFSKKWRYTPSVFLDLFRID